MTDMEQLLEDYYKDSVYIAVQKYHWLEPNIKISNKLRRASKRLKRFIKERIESEKLRKNDQTSNDARRGGSCK